VSRPELGWRMTGKTYREIFEAHDGREANKWDHYFEIYDTYLTRFRDLPVTMMEIGVDEGGSLELWRKYLGPDSRIVGVDINPNCRDLGGDGIDIFIGDQGDRKFMASIAEQVGPFDIVLDDGSHRMEDLRASFITLFRTLKAGGLYIAEDLHTCYWPSHGGGHRQKGTFIEDLKGVIDDLHAFHSPDIEEFRITSFTLAVKAVHFHDSIAVIEKTELWDETGAVSVPKQVTTGGRG
jgi:hypothetical protein